MLRIAAPQAPPPPAAAPDPTAAVAPPTPDAPPPADPTSPDDNDGDESQLPMAGHKVPQIAAGYLGAEYGPFACKNCVFFENPGSCSIVDGTIDPDACCNNYTSQAMQAQSSGGDTSDQDNDQEDSSDQASEDSSSSDGSVSSPSDTNQGQ